MGFVALWGMSPYRFVACWVCRMLCFSLIGFVALSSLLLYEVCSLYWGLSLMGFVAVLNYPAADTVLGSPSIKFQSVKH